MVGTGPPQNGTQARYCTLSPFTGAKNRTSTGKARSKPEIAAQSENGARSPTPPSKSRQPPREPPSVAPSLSERSGLAGSKPGSSPTEPGAGRPPAGSGAGRGQMPPARQRVRHDPGQIPADHQRVKWDPRQTRCDPDQYQPIAGAAGAIQLKSRPTIGALSAIPANPLGRWRVRRDPDQSGSGAGASGAIRTNPGRALARQARSGPIRVGRWRAKCNPGRMPAGRRRVRCGRRLRRPGRCPRA
jgi:hypothetical protein